MGPFGYFFLRKKKWAPYGGKSRRKVGPFGYFQALSLLFTPSPLLPPFVVGPLRGPTGTQRGPRTGKGRGKKEGNRGLSSSPFRRKALSPFGGKGYFFLPFSPVGGKSGAWKKKWALYGGPILWGKELMKTEGKVGPLRGPTTVGERAYENGGKSGPPRGLTTGAYGGKSGPPKGLLGGKKGEEVRGLGEREREKGLERLIPA